MTGLPPRLRRRDVPAYMLERHGIIIATSTLAKYATVGGGPLMTYSGRVPLYALDDLDSWADARLSAPVASTSERVRKKIGAVNGDSSAPGASSLHGGAQ